MKIICSILILAGVFALIDAFAMQLREEPQTPRLQELMRDRASPVCSQAYLQELSAILDTYNAATDECDNALQARLNELDEGATATLKELSASVATVCALSGECTESGPAVDNLGCFATKGQESSKTLSSVSIEASTARTQLQMDIANAKDIENVCNSKAWHQMSAARDAAQNKFNDCVNGITPTPSAPETPSSEASETAATEAPETRGGMSVIEH
ncbi:uncharacterized protein LOC129921036 [Episyrphus balteatus]|uniref:uncharacterized protein LOC129921036 n=1 Tax=Episyrphus balteatus TaxID=286459 RepID=UPI0024868778|nr:uncharacterized protein LOC129921036 [Episyrphus balteatus]